MRAIVVAVLALGACATLKNALIFQQPDIQLKQINVTGLGLTGGTLDLVFDVFNPNEYRIRSTRLEVGLDLEGVHFGDALLERPLDLSPTNHSEVIVPLRFEWAGVSAGARALLQRQAIKFGLNGAVLVDTPLGERRVGLQTTGDVPLRKFF
jgi:LEA14-like dessication related protein